MKFLGLRVEVAETGFEKMKGLMFRKNFNHALVFKLKKPTRLGASIHSFFVFFPFDIIWLRGNKIIDLRENVRPFTLNITPRETADCFVELPAGTIRRKHLRIGNIVKLD